jgi:hypothetical protein
LRLYGFYQPLRDVKPRHHFRFACLNPYFYKVRHALFILFWLIGSLLTIRSACAQNRVVVGRVLDADTRQGVDRSTMTNKRTLQRARTNTAGRWLLNAQPGDSLILTSLTHGRTGIRWTNADTEPIIIVGRIAEEDIRTIQLVEVQVRAKHEEQLKRELADILAEPKAIKGISGDKVLDYAANGSVISLLYDAFSREAKSRRKAVIINQEHRRHLLADYRLRQTVIAATDLTDDRIEQFMTFCNFDDEILLRATDYDLINIVQTQAKNFARNPHRPSGIKPEPK